MSKVKKFLTEKLFTARGIIILLAFGLAFHFDAPILGVLASAYLIFFLSKRVVDVRFSRSFENFIMVFLILSNFLGGDIGFYDTVPWWDEMLHFVYGLAFTLVGYRIIAIFFEERGIEKDKFIVLGFSFCFAIAIASMWEIYEYSMDQWFGDYFEEHGITLMQADKGSDEEPIVDTMNDIILAVASSAVMNLLLLGYLSRAWFKSLANYNFVLPSTKEEA